MKKSKVPTLQDKIEHAAYVMRSPNFLHGDSPTQAAKEVPLAGVPAEEIANLIVDMQFHGI